MCFEGILMWLIVWKKKLILSVLFAWHKLLSTVFFGGMSVLFTQIKNTQLFSVLLRLSTISPLKYGYLTQSKTFCFPRAPSAHCTTPADCCWRHLPLDPAERQLHQWGRPNHRQGGGIPHCVWHHVRPAARRQDHTQDRPPGSRHRVRDQCSADQTSGGRHRSPWTPSEGQDQMCWWGQKYHYLQSTAGIWGKWYIMLFAWTWTGLKTNSYIMLSM